REHLVSARAGASAVEQRGGRHVYHSRTTPLSRVAQTAQEASTMSLASRLTAALRTAARSPAVRRGVRDLGRAATRAVTRQRRGAGGGRRGRLHGTGPAPAPVSPDGEGAHAL